MFCEILTYDFFVSLAECGTKMFLLFEKSPPTLTEVTITGDAAMDKM